MLLLVSEGMSSIQLTGDWWVERELGQTNMNVCRQTIRNLDCSCTPR